MEQQKKNIVLVLDDEEAIAELVKLKLERSGFQVRCARDGIEGLEVLEILKPDLIILDILMPRMDGMQFLKEIKENTETAGIPVVVLTGHGAMRSAFEERGVSEFLMKPFDPDELVFLVHRALQKASGT